LYYLLRKLRRVTNERRFGSSEEGDEIRIGALFGLAALALCFLTSNDPALAQNADITHEDGTA